MKKTLLSLTLLGFIGFPCWLWAQDNPTNKKTESEEIIIRKKGDKNETIKIEINGDNVTINGKPMNEYKDDNVTIRKRKSIIMNEGGRRPRVQLFNEGFPLNEEVEAESRPFLGVMSEKDEKGARITEVVKGSAAETAGLKAGDVITKVDKDPITDPESLSIAIGAQKPKAEVKVSFLREGKSKSEKITLGERKEERRMIFAMPSRPGEPGEPGGFEREFNFKFDDDMPGINWDQLEDLGPRFGNMGRKKIGIKLQDTEEANGVKVMDVEDDSPAANSGLKKDDLITEIDGKKITNTDEAREQLKSVEGKSTYQVAINRNGQVQKIEVKIPKKLKTVNL